MSRVEIPYFASIHRHFHPLVLFIGFLFLIQLYGCQEKSRSADKSNNEKAISDQRVPNSLIFQTLDGGKILWSAEDSTWTVLHFWATWCKPCLTEFPELKEALPRLENDSIRFLIATDETIDQISAFQEKYVTGLELIRLEEGSLSDFKIYALPTTIIIDRQGKEIYRKVGQLDWKSIGSIPQLIAE